MSIYEQIKRMRVKLEEERMLGYPNFKNAIANSLVEFYSYRIEEALSLVYSPSSEKELMRDIVWSQHMGVSYWAELIHEKELSK